LLSTGWFHERI